MTTSALPGNPHAGPSPKGDAATQATLALAYEQRTQTLVSMQLGMAQLMGNGTIFIYDQQKFDERMTELDDLINARLGLDKEN